MRIGYLSYVDPLAWSGGGELVARALLAAAPACGHEVQVVALWPRPRLRMEGRVEGWVLADLWNIPERQRRIDQRLRRRLPGTAAWRFARILSEARAAPYVHLDNAYVDTCDLPYLPCNGEQAYDLCPLRPGVPCFRHTTRDLYERARATFFLSPLHERVVGRIQEGRARAEVVRPPMDPAPLVAARRQHRDVENLFVGAWTEAKGADRLGSRDGLVVITGAPPGPGGPPVPAGARVHVGVPYSDMPAWFGRAKRFVYRARWPEPFGRVVAEAALAGCQLDVQGQVGALSFERDPSNPDLYAGAAEEFWEKVSGALS